MLLYIVSAFFIIGSVVAGPSVIKSREEIEAFVKFLDKSRLDDGVLLKERMLRNPKAKAWENSGKYQGDILLDDEQVTSLVQQFVGTRNAYIWPNTTWPNDTIVYEFTAVFSEEQLEAILDGIADIEKNTCVKFRIREPTDEVYVRITGDPGGCYANVGYSSTRGVHAYNLALNTPGVGCFRHTTIVHEWLHILGFFHMQSTYNRDHYISVLYENIVSGLEYNFDKYSPETVDNLGLPYEYDSSMHYGPFGFSKNGLPTIVPLNDDKGLMGQRLYITDYDWLRVSRHYNCPGAWDDLDNKTEESEE